MIKIVNTEYRNIQEQVAKNTSDIADLQEELQEEVARLDIEDSSEAIQNKQLGFAIVVDPLTNINGKPLTAYGVQPKTVGGYPTYQVYKTTAPTSRLTKDEASNYLLALSGLGYAPEYDFDHPKYHYFVVGDGSEYLKPQWDNTNGLLLYRITAPYQGKLTAGDGIDITNNVISCTASGGGGAYQHRLSGTTASMDVLYQLIDADPTPITNTNFVDRVRFAFAMQSSSRQPFTNYCSQTGQYECTMTWQSGANAFSVDTVNFQNVSDVVTEL